VINRVSRPDQRVLYFASPPRGGRFHIQMRMFLARQGIGNRLPFCDSPDSGHRWDFSAAVDMLRPSAKQNRAWAENSLAGGPPVAGL